MTRELLAVALGGFVGTVLRHGTGNIITLIGASWLPFATLGDSVVGCFAMGYLAEWSLAHSLENHWWVVGLRAGVRGGLTTFSSFGLDIVKLWQTARPEAAVGLASEHIILGICAVILGMQIARA
jgi:CrcB protein